MVNHCSIPRCKTRRASPGIILHSVPINKKTDAEWLRALCGKTPTKNSTICSLHFTDSDYKPAIPGFLKRYLKEDAVPSQNLSHYDGVTKMVSSCFVPGCKTKSSRQSGIKLHGFPRDPKLARLWNIKLQSGKTPSKFSKVCSKHFRPEDYTESMTTGDTQVLKKGAIPSRNLPNKPIKHLVLLPEPDIVKEPSAPLPMIIPKTEKNTATTQTERQLDRHRATQTDPEPNRTESMNYDELTPEDFYFFTGLKLPSFKDLTEYLDIDKKSNSHSQKISNYDQLILTLTKLRHKFEFKILAKMYGIHRDIVHDIFVIWINVMYCQFRKTDLWAILDKGELGYTAILRCCEMPCQTNNSDFHIVLKSDNKKRLTIKYVVATDELGMVIFCSNQLFGGSITDREVIVQSGILSNLEKGDKILSDSDFNIDDLMKKNGVILHKPDDSSDVEKTKMYIKRIATMTKKFQILKGVFPAILMPHAPLIVYVTNVLANFVVETEDK